MRRIEVFSDGEGRYWHVVLVSGEGKQEQWLQAFGTFNRDDALHAAQQIAMWASTAETEIQVKEGD